jgi:hypothetical protein
VVHFGLMYVAKLEWPSSADDDFLRLLLVAFNWIVSPDGRCTICKWLFDHKKSSIYVSTYVLKPQKYAKSRRKYSWYSPRHLILLRISFVTINKHYCRRFPFFGLGYYPTLGLIDDDKSEINEIKAQSRVITRRFN